MIPARAGSKRLPGKNLRPLLGKPMLAYTIEAALASAAFPRVYVCTEDEAIAEAAVRHGATVPFLCPAELCGDLVPSHAPCRFVAARLGERVDSLVCLQPTSPTRSADDVRLAVSRFTSTGVDFLVSVTPIDPHYFHWAVAEQPEGGWAMCFGTRFLQERPLLPPVYRPNGSIKIARLSRLEEVGHFFGPNLGVLETPNERAIHVAELLDFEMCELVLRRATR
jgi:CMP-N-acetylneuraminic acid synthetase